MRSYAPERVMTSGIPSACTLIRCRFSTVESGTAAKRPFDPHERVGVQPLPGAPRRWASVDLRAGAHDARMSERSPRDRDRFTSDLIVQDLVMIEMPRSNTFLATPFCTTPTTGSSSRMNVASNARTNCGYSTERMASGRRSVCTQSPSI